MQTLLRILRDLILGWFPALIGLFRGLVASLRSRPRRRSTANRDLAGKAGPCVPLNSPVLVRPDPMIYDQYFLAHLGFAVTWDNPDIQLFRQGQPVSSSELTPHTEYQIVARIWNGSTDAPVVALPIQFSYLSFGVGTSSHPIGESTVDLGVKGGPNHPAFAVHPWTTPSAGHYCIQVQLQPFDDANKENNLGQENTQVGSAHSPATFTFALRNGGRVRRTYTFEVDAYRLTPPPPCPPPAPDQARGSDSVRGELSALFMPSAGGTHSILLPPVHERGHSLLPDGWRVHLNPSQPELDPDEEITVEVLVEPPPDFVGKQTVNVHARSQGILAGGVTLLVIV
jgi:hypothetical protein